MASFPVQYDPTRRIVNVHWPTGESPPVVFGVRIYNIIPTGGNGSPITIFPTDQQITDLVGSPISRTSPYPPGENAIVAITGTISGAPGPQASLPGYTINTVTLDGDLSLSVLLTGPGPNMTLTFDCSGYSVTDDSSPQQTFVANHLYISEEIINVPSTQLALGPA